MDLATLDWLRSAAGRHLLAELAASDLSDAQVLPVLQRLRARYTAEEARAAVELTLLRRRARGKLRQAERLYLTREALEQASSAPVAEERARRFVPGSHVGDICCGIGGDTLALARAGHTVTAVDRDPLRLALAAANAEELGLAGRITLLQADVLAGPPPCADALFCDPGRRAGGRRRFSTEQYEPPLTHVLGWRAQMPALAVKLAPGIDPAEVTAAGATGGDELEFVSLDGELKEALLWCGPLATATRRATLLRRPAALDAPGPPPDALPAATLTDAAPDDLPPLALPAGFLYEPDPAIIRAGLVVHLAGQLGAAQIDRSIAYLVAPTLQPTPFARAWQICEWFPFSLKQVRARLRALDVGSVTVKKRGSPLDTDALARQLRGKGSRPLVLVLTQVQQRPAALICEQALPR